MAKYNYEKCPQGVLANKNEANLNYDFLFAYIKNRLHVLQKIRILEIGAGGGRNLLAIQKKFKNKVELFGTDISQTAIAYARSLEIGRFRVTRSQIIPFKRKFDLILIIDLLEHLESKKAVRETVNGALDSLDQNGQIYISVPIELNWLCLTWYYSKLPYFRDLTKRFFGHTIQFDVKSFLRLIDTKKIFVVKTFYSVHFINQLQVLLFLYIPKILVEIFFGKRIANDLRDSNEVIKNGKHSSLSLIKKIILGLCRPVAYLGYKESSIRKNSSFAAGNIHLILGKNSRL